MACAMQPSVMPCLVVIVNDLPSLSLMDVWPIIGMWAYVVLNCASLTCEIDSDLTVRKRTKCRQTKEISCGVLQMQAMLPT
jgi:hypothetical protein